MGILENGKLSISKKPLPIKLNTLYSEKEMEYREFRYTPNLKRPILFYMYDLEEYRDNIRGFYLNIDELPGPILKTEEELIENIKTISEDFYNDKYKKFNDKFNYLDDGQASKRVVDKIFTFNDEKN